MSAKKCKCVTHKANAKNMYFSLGLPRDFWLTKAYEVLNKSGVNEPLQGFFFSAPPSHTQYVKVKTITQH